MPATITQAGGPLYQPPLPAGDLRGMLRRKIVSTALRQLAAATAARARLRAAAGWRAYGAGVRRRFAAALAHPDLQLKPGWRVRRVNQRACAGFAIENLLVESLPDCWMNVTVWKPDPACWAPPWPAIVTPVGHNDKCNPSEQYPPQVFAANGFLSLSFDPPGFGEKAQGNNHFDDGVRGYVVGQNPLAFFLADARRAVDYALSRPDVDGRGGVAMTGVSGGGFSTVGCAILDKRISVIGPSCFGLSDDIHPVRNGYAACPETLWLNRFPDGLGLVDLLIGARFVPTLAMMGKRDNLMTSTHVRRMTDPVRAAYAGAGVKERFQVLIDKSGHEYSVAQARAFVAWIRRWRGTDAPEEVRLPKKLQLLPKAELQCHPPAGFCMAVAAARAVHARQPVRNARQARRALAKLIPDLAAHRRRGLRAVTAPGPTVTLWKQEFQELSLRDGPDWELPATAVRSPAAKTVLVFFDDRGRWTALHQWNWLNRAAGVFGSPADACSILTVDLPGWGDTRVQPSPFDSLGWGGTDRWTGYISAATGESVMALRVREAMRVVDHVRRNWKVPAARIVIGGHGLGASVAGLVACLHGGLGGVLLLNPLARFADLATTARPTWPHDAYFPGILGAADLPEALALQPAPVLAVGTRDGAGRELGARASRMFRGVGIKVLPERFSAANEAVVLAWLKQLSRSQCLP